MWKKEGANIRKKIKVILKNITEKEEDIFDGYCIFNKNTYTYLNKDTTYKLQDKENKIILTRENDKIRHVMIFSSKIEKTEYYLKEYNNCIEFKIKTNNIEKSNNKIEISYTILDSDIDYIYIIEMSD